MELKKLYELSVLDLHSNKFSGSLDIVFNKTGSAWTAYTIIDVSSNKFKGPLSEDIGNKTVMKRVNSLILSNNPLGWTKPKSIGDLKYLEVLEMITNRLSGRIPIEIGGAKALKRLLLSRNRLTGSIPSAVLNLNKLQVFDVSRNRLSGKIPSHKSSFPTSAFSRNLKLCNAPLPPCK